jgi:hypothetical protein
MFLDEIPYIFRKYACRQAYGRVDFPNKVRKRTDEAATRSAPMRKGKGPTRPSRGLWEIRPAYAGATDLRRERPLGHTGCSSPEDPGRRATQQKTQRRHYANRRQRGDPARPWRLVRRHLRRLQRRSRAPRARRPRSVGRFLLRTRRGKRGRIFLDAPRAAPGPRAHPVARRRPRHRERVCRRVSRLRRAPRAHPPRISGPRAGARPRAARRPPIQFVRNHRPGRDAARCRAPRPTFSFRPVRQGNGALGPSTGSIRS